LVYIAGECTDVIIVDNTTLIATLPTYANIENPSNFLTASADVIVQAGDGKNALAYRRYRLQISLSPALLDGSMIWAKRNWFVILISGLAFMACVMICWCCFCKKKKTEVAV